MPVVLLVCFALLLPCRSLAASPQDLPTTGSALVKEVLSVDTLVLADGRVVRLAGVQGPRPAGGPHGHGRPWPLAAEARAALEALALGRTVSLHGAGGPHQDRHDRTVAQLVRDDGLWLQGELLGQGWLRVYVSPDLRQLGPEMYAQERAAREAHRGIWDNHFYAVRTPDGLSHDYDSFQLVEGRVVSVTLAKGQLFLDFSTDWRTGFAAFVPRRVAKPFRQAFGDPHQLKGRVVRVRGWVFHHFGPEIEITTPEQLELVEPPAPAATETPEPTAEPAPTPAPAQP